MKIPIYQLDAFTDEKFKGNPAAVCLLEEWLDDEILQNIAAENNLAETAFFIKLSKDTYHLRWFTPEIEMDLCGHATLATAYVIFEELNKSATKILFESKSGILTVHKQDSWIALDFPSRPPVPSSLPSVIGDGLSIQPSEVWKARDYLLVYDSAEDIRLIQPDIATLNQINLDPGGIIVTASCDLDGLDFVSRFFTPNAAVFEDPVTGSAHCTLIPFWSERLNKTTLIAQQWSTRGGTLRCKLLGDRVSIRGQVVKYMEGTIEL